MNRDIIAFTKYKFNVYGNKDIRSGKDSAVVGIVGKSKSLDFPTMLIFWSLVRNSVVLAVYLLFSVACFLTVHEHFEPGCRNNWHVYKAPKGGGQVLVCVADQGYYHVWEKEVRKLYSGDVFNIPANVKHWHGATKDSWFFHLANEVPAENGS